MKFFKMMLHMKITFHLFRRVKKECVDTIIGRSYVGDWLLFYLLGQNIDSGAYKVTAAPHLIIKLIFISGRSPWTCKETRLQVKRCWVSMWKSGKVENGKNWKNGKHFWKWKTMTKEASLEKICLRLRRPIVYRCILYEIDDIDILLDNHLLALTVMDSGKLGGFRWIFILVHSTFHSHKFFKIPSK